MPSKRSPGLIQNLRTTFLTLENTKNVIFWYVVYRYFTKTVRHLRARGIIPTFKDLYLTLARNIFQLILLTPAAQRRVKRELGVARQELKNSLVGSHPELSHQTVLPALGKDKDWIIHEIEVMSKLKADGWEEGKVSGAVYHGHRQGDNLVELGPVIELAVNKFMLSNPLHPSVFPAVRKMEAEVVRMCLDMFNIPTGKGAGTTTSGGTESILMACKTYRDWARSTKGITEPEMVIPRSAHAAFDKAGAYFGIKIHHIDVDILTRKVNIRAVARAINSNTILLVGSAPNFPDGIIDDIPALASLAVKYKLGLHVDCCLGSFIVPFLEKAGFPTEPFDFRINGVTSISCDTHKYGFAPKGTSVIMYRTEAWRRWQFYVSTSWPGGVYASPTMAGSRPGAVIAGAWVAMMTMGERGYTQSCREIVTAAKRIESGLKTIPGLYILGNPLASVVAFGSKANIYQIGDLLSKKGWHLNALQHPPSLHICCTRPTIDAVDQFLTDVRNAVKDSTDSSSPGGDMVLLYGLGASQVAGPGLVTEVGKMFCEVLYEVEEV